MRTVSLTGRPWQELDKALIERAHKIGVLTDREHTPATIAARMLEYGYTDYTMYIGEHLGNPERERIRQLGLEEASEEVFEHPNNLLLYADTSYKSMQTPCTDLSEFRNHLTRPFGLPDEQFAHLDGRARMITKAPIRLLTLQVLELNRRRVFWDIGFCTGSVSIEARLQFPHLTIVSFEIRPEGEELMRINSRRFGAPGITALIGDFLQTDLEALPRPDAVFIGGHGGKLENILVRLKEVLQPNGCIVFNSVSESSKELFRQGVHATGMTLHSSLRIIINNFNPIEIMKATI
jgi:precorrin-6Y C5,15-methyltransferase (decarboxylating)